MIEPVREFDLDDGRKLIVVHEGEVFGWTAYTRPGRNKPPALAATPLGAMIVYLGDVPEWAKQASADIVREFAEAPRYACECCGFLTLLNVGQYEICQVCGWEDDRSSARPYGDESSGPNQVSLRQGRENFAAFGASKERSVLLARPPRPDEFPEASSA